MFKYSYRHRLLKISLIAAACHQGHLGHLGPLGQLFSAIEPPQVLDYPNQSRSLLQIPEGISSEQIHTLIYPDDSSSYASAAPFYYPQHQADVFLEPKDGQWPVFTSNEWENNAEPLPQSSYEKVFASPSFENQAPIQSFETEPLSTSSPASLQISFPVSHSTTDHLSPQPINQNEASKQNFITFDRDIQSGADKEQHPITKEGEAKAYPFEKDNVSQDDAQKDLLDSSPTPLPGNEPLPSPKSNENKSLINGNEPQSLSESKGHIKFSRKRPPVIPPAERLEEALKQKEEVIGKSTANHEVISMLDNEEDTLSLSNQDVNNSTDTREKKNPLNPPATSPIKKSSDPDERDSEIAQNSTPGIIPNLKNPKEPQIPDEEQESLRTPTIITAGTARQEASSAAQGGSKKGPKEISINFNNVAMVEYIRFISRLSNKNFIFDDEDLQFSVTIVSEEPTTIENLMTALLQELRIRDLSLMEQGNNIIIHRNPRVRSPARIVSDDNRIVTSSESELVTRVFRLNTLDPQKASEIIRPLISEDALIEVLRDTNNLIITDLVTNVNKVAELIGTLDAPNSGVTIGQYVVRNAFVDSLVDLANKILQPIAQGNPFVLVPHPVSNSIFIVSNSFIVEKALAILQNLDLNEGRTKILSLETLQPLYESLSPAYPNYAPSNGAPGSPLFSNGRQGTFQGGAAGAFPGGGFGQAGGLEGSANAPGRSGPGGSLGPFGQGNGDPNEFGAGGLLGGGGGYGPGGQYSNIDGVPDSFPLGGLSTEGRLNPQQIMGQGSPFGPGGIGTEGRPSAIFDENRSFSAGGIGATSRWAHDLPVGHIERTLFFIYKLRYRKGDNIEIALRKIANSLQLMNTANADLISAINSSQWIESSNALIFTGTATALDKVRELILEVDVPLRQVFIEMLILDTTIKDSLTYSVDWINRFGGGTTTGEEGFVNSIPGAGVVSTDNFLTSSETIFSSGSVTAPAAASPLPVATGFMNSAGFVAGVIGTHLTHNGTQFSSIGALVRAIHNDVKADIILNPKIITEDNNPAEIFVGSTDRYKTQSITNDLGSLVTNNFQFIDVGTTLRVTPLIGNNGIITLEIIQETTSESPTANTGANGQDYNLVEVLRKTRTVTKVHVPNGFFVILSGMIKDNQIRSYSRIPCLGGIPLVGCFGKTQTNADSKSNLMLFIRPLIIESDEELEDITRRQQDVYQQKSKFRRSWNYEIDEALNFSNIKPTDPDDMDCSINERQQR